MPEYVQAQRNPGEISMNKLELVAPGKIPAELTLPAAGRFPLIEQALYERNTRIPTGWSVENMLAAGSAGAAAVARQQNDGWRPESPTDVRLILDEDRYGISKRTGQLGYSAVDFEVEYPDKVSIRGKIAVPGFLNGEDVFAGVPMVMVVHDTKEIDVPEKHSEVFGENNLVDTQLRRFTAKGLHFISFLQGVISGYEDYYTG